uniref:DPBB_1 domain-containing protein n=1 Tax=Meloidogyne hapla TaxID=6305 RepID=A0A1I8BDB5_MELHA
MQVIRLFLNILLIFNFILNIHAQNDLTVYPIYNIKDTCLNPSAWGPINLNINKPFYGGKFTLYGIGGRGACGLDIDAPAMSAAASGSLFVNAAQWVPSCLPDKRYLLEDSMCIHKCVKITYKCVGCSDYKTLTVPINNKCPECAIDHVDLSIEAFKWLEPQGGTVGVAKGYWSL